MDAERAALSGATQVGQRSSVSTKHTCLSGSKYWEQVRQLVVNFI